VPHPVIFAKPTSKNEASKFSRKDANCSSLIALVDITVGIVLFGGAPPAVSTVWEHSGVATARLPRLIEEAQRSALISARKRMVVVRAERGQQFDTTFRIYGKASYCQFPKFNCKEPF
jgi:hypothetical protein